MAGTWKLKSLMSYFRAVLVGFSICSQGIYVATASCSSKVAEANRMDCFPENRATEAKCRCRGCQWCNSSTPSVPWCYHDSYYDELAYLTLKAECPSCQDCKERIDCHPDPDATQERCIARSCLWCPNAVSEPWCIYGGVERIHSFTNRCPTCTNCTNPVNCLAGDSSPTSTKCTSRGCLWCSSQIPQCRYGGGTTAPVSVRSMCPTCDACIVRHDCHPDPGATQATCQARQCTWCVSSIPGEPWCVYGSSAAAVCLSCTNCNTKIDCHPEPLATKWSCEYRGCLWCPSITAGVAFCVYPTT